VPKGKKQPSFDLTIEYRDGVEDVSEEEFRLIEANLPELLKLMMEELAE
jgi:hypothetical protein